MFEPLYTEWAFDPPEDYETRQTIFWVKNGAEDKFFVELCRATMLEF